MSPTAVQLSLRAFLLSAPIICCALPRCCAAQGSSGEDLLLTAIERLLQRWRRFDGDPEGYLRRTMCNLAIDSSDVRSRWRSKEGLFRTTLRPVPDVASEWTCVMP